MLPVHGADRYHEHDGIQVGAAFLRTGIFLSNAQLRGCAHKTPRREASHAMLVPLVKRLRECLAAKATIKSETAGKLHHAVHFLHGADEHMHCGRKQVGPKCQRIVGGWR